MSPANKSWVTNSCRNLCLYCTCNVSVSHVCGWCARRKPALMTIQAQLRVALAACCFPFHEDTAFIGAGGRGRVSPDSQCRGAPGGPDRMGLSELGLPPLPGVPSAEAVAPGRRRRQRTPSAVQRPAGSRQASAKSWLAPWQWWSRGLRLLLWRQRLSRWVVSESSVRQRRGALARALPA